MQQILEIAKNCDLIFEEIDTLKWKNEMINISNLSLLPKSRINLGLKLIEDKIVDSSHGENKEKWQCFFENFKIHFIDEVGYEAISFFKNLHSTYRVFERYSDTIRKGLKKSKINNVEKKICCKKYFRKS